MKKGDILVAKDNFTVKQTGGDMMISSFGDNCLTKNKHYEIIRISKDEVYILNDLDYRDFFIHNWKFFFHTLKELREIKLKELLK